MGKLWNVENRKTCAVCGGPIPEGERRRTYCSKKCRTKFYNMKSRSTPELRRKANEALRENWRKKHIDGKLTIKCLICGKSFRQVGSHIVQTHKMTAREYRRLFGMDVKKGIITEDLKELYGRQVKENNTVANLKAGAPFRFKPGDQRAGRYERSAETMERLKKQGDRLRSNKLI